MNLPASALRAVVVGAGPAGLAAAREFGAMGVKVDVLEKSARVGGIARTEVFEGYHFDMGGHRFYTKSEAVKRFWHEVMGDDFLVRPRQSRIFYKKKFFHYPPQIYNTLTGLGIFESARVVCSWLRWKIAPHKVEETFEQWVTNRFGKRLFQIFFESYTEKVWGISCSELSAEWAAQRIKGVSMRQILEKLLLNKQTNAASLIEEFHYPRRGPGMLWERVASQLEQAGNSVYMESDVVKVHRREQVVTGISTDDGTRFGGDYFVSSMPLPELIRKLDPPPPEHVLAAAEKLSHRDFLTVCLVIDHPKLFPDNWIYVHEPDVLVGRIQNYKNWSEEMVPDPSRTSLGLEYFCNKTDPIWQMEDEALIALGAKELAAIGLAEEHQVLAGCVHRVPDAYPVYDSTYADQIAILRAYCDQFQNLATIGRNGLHRYNNQDHSMLTGMLAARNLHCGEANDLWKINAEQSYLEEVQETLEPVTAAG